MENNINFINEVPVIFDDDLSEALFNDGHRYYIESEFRNDIDGSMSSNPIIWTAEEINDYEPDVLDNWANEFYEVEFKDLNDADKKELILDFMHDYVWDEIQKLIQKYNCKYLWVKNSEFGEGSVWSIRGDFNDLVRLIKDDKFFDLLGDFTENDIKRF